LRQARWLAAGIDGRYERLDPIEPARFSFSTMRAFYVYIMAIRKNGTLYIGVTNDIVRRSFEHREGLVRGFTESTASNASSTSRAHATAGEAIQRETTMKHWSRAWKIALIERDNPNWDDLYPGIDQRNFPCATPVLHRRLALDRFSGCRVRPRSRRGV